MAPTDNDIPTFAPVAQPSANPIKDHPDIETFINDIARGGERLVQKVSNDINEISIRRAMQIGYMMACQDHNLEVPKMNDPAKELGYGNI